MSESQKTGSNPARDLLTGNKLVFSVLGGYHLSIPMILVPINWKFFKLFFDVKMKREKLLLKGKKGEKRIKLVRNQSFDISLKSEKKSKKDES